ncbi:MAG: xanthine dehydrogenase family protein molybdopterin-binding subunit [Anaerolineae bacterium]
MAEKEEVWKITQDPDFQMAVAEDWEEVEELILEHQDELPGFGAVPPEKPAAKEEFDVLGRWFPQMQGAGVVTGQGQYVQTLSLPGMLHMKTLRSPHPHARIKSIDTSKAEALPGVHAVLHRGNLPEELKDVTFTGGALPRYIFNEELLEVGHAVAAVAAEDEHIADEAINLIEVEYEVLPAVLDMFEAQTDVVPKLWDNENKGTIVGEKTTTRGDLAKGFDEADLILEGEYTTSVEFHQHLESHVFVANWESSPVGDKLVLWGAVQGAHSTRQAVSRYLKMPMNLIRVIQTGFMGSGYGNKGRGGEYTVHAALLAKMTGRPIRAEMTRSEDTIIHSHRYATQIDLKSGVKKDGTLTALQARVAADVGAQVRSRATGPLFPIQQLFTIPNAEFTTVDVFTNKYKAGALRCVGHPQGTWAIVTHMDRVAYELGMDPLEFLLKNINEVGNQDNDLPFSEPLGGLRECLVQAAERIGWKENWHAPGAKEVRPGVFHGIGITAHVCTHGSVSPPMSGQVKFNPDGTLEVVSAAQEIGGGQRTVMAMMAAEEMGLPIEQVKISADVDTEFTTDTGGTWGSRMTVSGGWGVVEAVRDAKAQLLEVAAKLLEVEPDVLVVKLGEIFVKDDPDQKVTVAEAVGKAGYPIHGRGWKLRPTQWQQKANAAAACEVEVDTAIGQVRVTRFVAAHDIGRALNPRALEQQIEGGVIMAIGAALTEELLVDAATGLPLNDNLLDYKLMTIKDVPRTIEVILVEYPREYGPFGAHGIGEPAIATARPAIGNAIFNATGVRLFHNPMLRDKLFAAMKSV